MSNPNQRTKGNVKPSNSERAARLLSSNQFLSFSQASQNLSNVYTSNSTASTESDASSFQYGISPDFQVIFKHMTKKDINTKLKALQDFSALCVSKDGEELSKISSYWYRVYRKLSNAVDWRVRQEVHRAHFQFISKFDRETIANDMLNVSGSNSAESGESTNEVSFQNLITMPAIMWTSCFDAYAQAANASLQNLSFLYQNERIPFLIANYESILNYCAYCIFNTIPIKLFYSYPLPPESVKIFEELLLVTSLRGLSSMINELLDAHLRSKVDDDDQRTQVLYCLEQIFMRLNKEFAKSKLAHLQKSKPDQVAATGDNSEKKEDGDEAFLSKKEKKKLKKEEKENANNQKKNQTAKGHCKFWNYSSFNNGSIRVAFFHALSSITRLTSAMDDCGEREESAAFETLNASNQLWFKLFKTNLYEVTFRSFADQAPEVRGLAWLLGTHLLSRGDIYKPWSVLNQEKWLKDTLIEFVFNGMRTAGGILDFGLRNIAMDDKCAIYREFFTQQISHLDGLELVSVDVAETDMARRNVRLVIAFAHAFCEHQTRIGDESESFKIFQTLLCSLNGAFTRTVLQKDIDLLIEIYFDLIYNLLIRCLRLTTKKSDEQTSENLFDSQHFSILFDQIFQTYLSSLILKSLEFSSSDLLCNSQMYRNLLVLASKLAERCRACCDSAQSNFDEKKADLQMVNTIRFNMQKLYSNIFSQIDSELRALISREVSSSKLQLSRLLRFLNDSILFRPDGYLSAEYYYCSRGSSQYDKNLLKILRSKILPTREVAQLATSRRVNFSPNQDEEKSQPETSSNEISIQHIEHCTPPADWWSARRQKSIFTISLINTNYKPLSSSAVSRSISLLSEYGTLFDEIARIVVKLINLVDLYILDSTREKEEQFLLLQHIQFILRAFNDKQLLAILSELRLPNEKSSPFCSFVKTYLIKWLNVLKQNCQHKLGGELDSPHIRFSIILASKIVDVWLVCFFSLRQEDFDYDLFSLSDAFTCCIVSAHLNRLSTSLPLSTPYRSTVDRFRLHLSHSANNIAELVCEQIDTLFDSSNSKTFDCEILFNLLQLLFDDEKCKLKNNEEAQISKIGSILTRLFDRLNRSADAPISEFEPFLLDFPLLCREIYRFLFDKPHLVLQIANLQSTLIDFTKLIFRQTFTLSLSGDKQAQLVSNNIAFWTFSLQVLSKDFPRYETSLKQLIHAMIDIVIDAIVHSKVWCASNFKLIDYEIKQFIDCLIETFKTILPRLDSEDVAEICEQFHIIENSLYAKFDDFTRSFSCDNVFGLLYELQRDVSSRHKLDTIYDLFKTENNIEMLEKMNDSNVFDAAACAKFAQFKQSLFVDYFRASIARHLLVNVYFEPTLQDSLRFDLASSLSTAEKSTSAISILSSIPTLVYDLYDFNRFMGFYFYKTNESEQQQQQKQQFTEVCNGLRHEVETILDVLSSMIKKTKNDDNLLIRFICFLITSENGSDLKALSYADFVVKNFFPAVNYMQILNYIGLPNKFDRTFDVSRITCAWIAHTENVEKINEILAQALRRFESSAISESYREPKSRSGDDTNDETKEASLLDWSRLPTNEINQSLLIAAYAFYRLSSMQFSSTAAAGPIAQLKERLLNLLTLLTWGKLEYLFDANIPRFSHAKNLTYWLISQMITDAVRCLDGSAKPEHFRMFLGILKMWIQILYTSLPESVESDAAPSPPLNVLALASEIFHTLHWFGGTATVMSTSDDDSNLEAIELWRNFLAFDSFNMLLPLFVVLNSAPDRNLLEHTYMQRLVQLFDYVDMECLRDISALEINQYLLMYPEERTKQRRGLETMLNKFIENAQLSSESVGKPSKSMATTIDLTLSNPYYDYLLSYGCPLLLHFDHDRSLSVFRVLCLMLHDLPWKQKSAPKKANVESDTLSLTGIDTKLLKEEDIRLGPPESISKLLLKLDRVTEYVLIDCEFGQSVLIDQNSDVYNYTFAYLLVWLLYLHMIDPFPVEDENEARADLILFLTERNLHYRLFDNLFHLMPNADGHEDEDSAFADEPNAELLEKIGDLAEAQNLCQLIGGERNSLPKLALIVYCQVLRNLPNLLRSWFGALKPPQKAIVDDFTIHHFTRLMIAKELDYFKSEDREKFGNIVMRTSKKANEITAVYSLREISFGIRFTFKVNYPLTPVTIECFNRSGVSEDRCRKWIHRLTTFFNKQNCSIMNAIILLRPNMDKFFEDIEECMICLFVLYGATAELPRFKCPQCRKKFHWACIRKWFQTNNNSSCPQCKYEFQ